MFNDKLLQVELKMMHATLRFLEPNNIELTLFVAMRFVAAMKVIPPDDHALFRREINHKLWLKQLDGHVALPYKIFVPETAQLNFTQSLEMPQLCPHDGTRFILLFPFAEKNLHEEIHKKTRAGPDLAWMQATAMKVMTKIYDIVRYTTHTPPVGEVATCVNQLHSSPVHLIHCNITSENLICIDGRWCLTDFSTCVDPGSEIPPGYSEARFPIGIIIASLFLLLSLLLLLYYARRHYLPSRWLL